MDFPVGEQYIWEVRWSKEHVGTKKRFFQGVVGLAWLVVGQIVEQGVCKHCPKEDVANQHPDNEQGVFHNQ